MTNNDVLRRLRYTFDFNDDKMAAIFLLGGLEVSRELLSNWLKRDEDPQFLALSQDKLAAFLNGLIIEKRGPREEPPGASSPPEPPAPELLPPEPPLTNNIILRKLRIAMNFKEAEMLSILDAAGLPVSRPELSALFRKVDHPHYRVCQDQILRNFLRGLQLKVRGTA